MKPAPFDYYAPTGIEEALDLLASMGYGIKILAGGQSLVPAMNFRLSQPSALLDLNNIPELSYIRETPEGIVIGAMTRDSEVEHDPLIAEKIPLIPEAMPFIAHPQIRNRGTFGGAIAHADPTGQLPALSLVLNARYHIRSKTEDRWVDTDDFFQGPFTTSINPEDLLVEVLIPTVKPHTGMSYQQMARQAGAQALVGVASVVTLEQDGRCLDARIGYLSVGETPMLAPEAARKLIGQMPTDAVIDEAAKTAATIDIPEPGSDIHCSEDYRRHLIEVLTARSLQVAFERAKQRGE